MERINFGFIFRQGATTTTAVEEEIDRMVYDSNSNKKMPELYTIINNFGSVLTEEERKIVEGV